jgi:predicted DNA-binding protein (MmcQ/YjbR family)
MNDEQITLDDLRNRLLAKRDACEETPFGPDVLVYKVRGRIFALVAWKKTPLTLSLKCEPLHALALRDQYAAIRPGYHLNKRHWNTATLDGSIPDSELNAMIDESYILAAKGLSKADRRALWLA